MVNMHAAYVTRDTSALAAVVRDPAQPMATPLTIVNDVYALQRLPQSVLKAELRDGRLHVAFSRYKAAGGWIADGVAIGISVEIASNAVVFPRVTLGNYAKIRWRSIVYEDATISHHAMVGINVVINKHASIGEHVSVPDGVIIHRNARVTPQTVMKIGRGIR